MKSLSLRVALLGMVACAALVGCGLGPVPTVQLITDRPEMTDYVDHFNSLQSDVRVEVSYQEIPYQAVLDGVSADVVVGEYLASPSVMDRLDPLGDLVKPGKLDPSWFYPGLLAMGSRDNRPMLIPLSFTLPTVVFEKQSVPTDLPPMILPLDTLQSLGQRYNQVAKNGALSQVGFSPLWNRDFLTSTALLYGARFRAARNGSVLWDENGLEKTVDATRQWFQMVNGGGSADQDFRDRYYQVQPWYKLLSTGRVLFALESFPSFFALPEDKRRDLDFRWLSIGNAIPVNDDALFAGILRSSRNKGRARAFLQWFCNLSEQSGLLDVNQSRRTGVFGVTDGFSSFRSTNSRDLAQRYPLLLGHIPLENMLVFPDTLADGWQRLRDEVITRWMEQSALGQASEPLDKAIADWQQAAKKQ